MLIKKKKKVSGHPSRCLSKINGQIDGRRNDGQVIGSFHVYVIFYLIFSNITEKGRTKMILKELLSPREVFENEMYKINLIF